MADDSMMLVSDWCESVIDALRPQKVFIVGNEAEEMTGCFAEKNISAVNTSWAAITGTDVSLPDAYDVVILDCTSEDMPLVLPETGFVERLGVPQTILAMIPLAESGPSLPEVSRWLHRFGYTHDFSEDHWFAQRSYNVTFRKGPVDTDELLWQQEAALWRLAQLNQKRRLLLSEYMGEVIETTLHYSSLVLQLNVSNQNIEKELERQTEYSSSLQSELKRQEEWAKTLQNEVKQQEERAALLQHEVKQQEERAALLQHEVKQQEERASLLQQELTRQEEWAKTLQHEVKQREEGAALLQQELTRQEEWARTLQNEAKQQEARAAQLQQELNRQEEWAKTLQNEVEQRTNAYNGLLEENSALQKERSEWKAFQESKFGKLWKQFRRSGG